MTIRITSIEALDVRFPTSREKHGSDAMNLDPDYSAAYCTVHTNLSGLEGHGLTFTIGRGNELCVAAIKSLSPLVVGLDLDEIQADLRGFWRRVTGDSQLRWVGPDKGVIHMAAGALVNAVWDLLARRAGKPIWKLVSEWSPQDIVRAVDFSRLEDFLPEAEALERLQEHAVHRAEWLKQVEAEGIRAYTTSAGWLGYAPDLAQERLKRALEEGWSDFKLKVGNDIHYDVGRAHEFRSVVGDEARLMLDANQVWSVSEAIRNMKELVSVNPWWIEEPTHPDDILGHAAIAESVSPIRVATGEMCANSVMFKQFLAARGMGVCQVDACRVAGLNEVLAVLLLAERAGVPVCPHAGGVGLSEYVQHIALIDSVAVSGPSANRVVEYVDHLHEHFEDPVRVEDGHYIAPTLPGYSVRMRTDSLRDYAFPNGRAWRNTD